jgi:hypothetical protein
MERVTGVGGVFFRAEDPGALVTWYSEHLGVPVNEEGYVIFPESRNTVWAPFSEDTESRSKRWTGSGASAGRSTPRGTASSSGSPPLQVRERAARRHGRPSLG